MSKIKVLDKHLQNLIAAGEVVDRPSSIVKELIENSIDAKAKHIIVKIKNGGLDEIVVSDNGEGMSKDDLALAFLAHSTSKITQAHDLNHLTSLGFRGEALAAIGAVSNCEIISSDSHGSYIITNKFGKISKIEAQSRNKGTTVSVKELFYQSPARLKFLKSVDYETALISDLIQKFALSNLDINFQYSSNDRVVFNSPGNNDLAELLFNIYGSNIYQRLRKLEISNYDFIIKGYISDSHYSRSNKTGINIFINNRLVAANSLIKAITTAYSDYLAKGKYPLVILKVETDPQLTDVNISPTKWQIRISKEKNLNDLLISGIKGVLKTQSEAQLISTINSLEVNEYPVTNIKKEEVKQEKVVYQQLQLNQTDIVGIEPSTLELKPEVIGQAFGKYIIASCLDELWLIDQHAAQERCNYEKFRQAMLKENPPVQIINLPPLEVSLSHIQRLKEINEKLAAINIQFEEYGVNKLLVRSIPLWISQIDVEAFLFDMLEYCCNSDKEIDITEIRKATLASLACHSSIKFNEILDINLQKALVNDLLKCENPYHCPHGRPTIVKLSDKQLAKEFERG